MMKPQSNAGEDGNAKSREAELTAQKHLNLRLAADFDNFRKRTARESDRRAAAEKEAFIRDLLPIIDNLERALASDASTEQLRDGVRMTLQQLHQLLSRHGIETEKAIGLPFDPHRHEAVATRHDLAQPDHTVIEILQPGYRRGDVVFRPAKVIVNDLNHKEAGVPHE
jgi:molecular chaperone GrpE